MVVFFWHCGGTLTSWYVYQLINDPYTYLTHRKGLLRGNSSHIRALLDIPVAPNSVRIRYRPKGTHGRRGERLLTDQDRGQLHMAARSTLLPTIPQLWHQRSEFPPLHYLLAAVDVYREHVGDDFLHSAPWRPDREALQACNDPSRRADICPGGRALRRNRQSEVLQQRPSHRGCRRIRCWVDAAIR